MRVLVTGITGFVGSHFAEHALSKGAEVYSSYRWPSKAENIDHLIGDASKIARPAIPFERTLRDLLEYWRARVVAPR